MLNQDDVRDVLTLQSQAYALLMWLGEAALKDPILLSPAVVAVLSDAGGSLDRDSTGAAPERAGP